MSLNVKTPEMLVHIFYLRGGFKVKRGDRGEWVGLQRC